MTCVSAVGSPAEEGVCSVGPIWWAHKMPADYTEIKNQTELGGQKWRAPRTFQRNRSTVQNCISPPISMLCLSLLACSIVEKLRALDFLINRETYLFLLRVLSKEVVEGAKRMACLLYPCQVEILV